VTAHQRLLAAWASVASNVIVTRLTETRPTARIVHTMRLGAVAAASVASAAAASVALAPAWGQRIHGVRPDHPTPSGASSVPHVALAPDRSWASSLCPRLLAVIARNAYIAAEIALVAAPSLSPML